MTRTTTEPTTVGRLLDLHAAERGDHPFLIFGDDTTSYAQMSERTTRLANSFADLGMHAGDRIAILSSNRPEFLDVWFASARLGAIEVPVNIALRGRFLSYILGNSGARFLAVEEELLPHVATVADALTSLETVIVIGQGELAGFRTVTIDDLFTAGAATPVEVDIDVTGTAVIGYTSGTTGPSKGVMISHRASFYAGADNAAQRGLTGDDVFSTCLPLFHLNAQHLTTIAVLSVGATLALEPRFSARAFWGRMASVRATHVNLIGAMLGILARQPESAVERTDYPRMCFAAPLSGEVIAEAHRRWNVGFITGYGATESGIVTYTGTEGLPEGSCGKPSPHFEVDLVDDNGHSVAVDEVGEFVTRPRRAGSMMSEYWGMPEKTVEAYRDLWFHSGDLGRRDADGYFYFVDRKKDALRRRGENVSSFELEQAISEYPGIAEVAVIAVPSELSEDDIKVCLRRAPEAEIDPVAFLEWATDNLPRFMIPRYVEVMDEFPRTPTARVEKYRLREVALSATTWDADRSAYLEGTE